MSRRSSLLAFLLVLALALAAPAAAQRGPGRGKAKPATAQKKAKKKAREGGARSRTRSPRTSGARAKDAPARDGAKRARAKNLRRGSAPRVRVIPARGRTAKRWKSALGRRGPLGALGPLGRYGPIGGSIWNPSFWFRAAGDWTGLRQKITRAGGPLSKEGPLGPKGPLGESHGGFPKELRAGGDLAALGPDGPLGALGPLGPLGPVGGHGYATDANGNYVKDGRVKRTIDVPYGKKTRTYELFESYSADYAAKKKGNDTSFMASGELGGSRGKSQYTFPFRSRSRQFVNLLVTPETSGGKFRLEVLDGKNNVIGRGRSDGGPTRLQLFAPAGARLKARVRPAEGQRSRSRDFRLYVVGSTPYNL